MPEARGLRRDTRDEVRGVLSTFDVAHGYAGALPRDNGGAALAAQGAVGRSRPCPELGAHPSTMCRPPADPSIHRGDG